MLVLSRGCNDKVVFPTLGMSVEILRIAGNKIRLGIDAPQEIPVLRHEVAHRVGYTDDPSQSKKNDLSRATHAMRNRIHTAVLGLHLLHNQFECGENRDAEATIFKIFNELRAIEDELDPAAGSEHSSETSRIRRTLVVEDDSNERELLAGYLRISGFDVDTANDGLQAMTHLAKHQRPDVVLMDMRMPRFDGRKAVAAIRANPDYRSLKVFAVSGTQQSKTRVDVGPQGVDRWFCKPVNPEKIVEAIREEIAENCVPA
jgi:carbon storage regulator CsrA